GTLRALSNRGRRAEGGATPSQEKEQVGGPAAQRRWGSSLPRRRGPVQRAVRRGGARCTGPGRVGDSPSLGRGPVPGLAAKRAGRFSGFARSARSWEARLPGCLDRAELG